MKIEELLEEIAKLPKEEALKVYMSSTQRLQKIDFEEMKDSDLLIENGKKYKAANGDIIFIVDRYINVFRGKNLTTTSKDPKDKFPEYYINGKKSREKDTPLDLIEEHKE